MQCPSCGHRMEPEARFCNHCGAALRGRSDGHAGEDLNLPILYVMVAVLIAALLVPPWESPAGEPAEFLGFHFILDAPSSARGGAGIVSRLLLTVEVTTIAVAGLYFSWLFRGKGR